MRGIERAMQDNNAASLCGGGGVLANHLLRERLGSCAASAGMRLRLPPMGYCIDNAAMIAGLGAIMLSKGHAHGMDLHAVARLPIGHQA